MTVLRPARALVFISRLACACAALTACTPVTTTAGHGGAGSSHPHELRVAQLGDVSSLNPLLTSELTASWPDQLALAYLCRHGRDNELVPELATVVPTQANGGISADGKTIAYHLRRGVKWSDGAPFTAADVAFSTGVINDPKTNVESRQGWDQIAKIDVPDPYTVIFHLKTVYSPFVQQTFSTGVAGPAILPKHLLAHTANINTDPYNALPVGIGPFKFVKWARADRIELVANPLYWRGRPKLDRIVFKIIPNRETIFGELQTHDVDLWPFFPQAYLARASSLSGSHLLRFPGFAYGHLDFNTRHAVLADAIVRRALLLAWDRRTQRAKIGHGAGILQDSVVSPQSGFFDPKIGFTELDTKKANALLDEDGWKRGSDGVRAKNGLRLNLELVSNTGSPDTDARIELLRQDWRAVGVTFVRKNYDPNLLLAPAQEGGIIMAGKYDVSFSAWAPPASGDFSGLYGCKAIPPGGQNDLYWCDVKADAAMNDFLATFDAARQKRDVFALQEEMFRQTPTIVSTIYENLFGVADGVKGFHPNAVSFFDGFMNVDV